MACGVVAGEGREVAMLAARDDDLLRGVSVYGLLVGVLPVESSVSPRDELLGGEPPLVATLVAAALRAAHWGAEVIVRPHRLPPVIGAPESQSLLSDAPVRIPAFGVVLEAVA